jgi:hypothetical protein
MAAMNSEKDVKPLEEHILRHFPIEIYRVVLEERDGVEPGIDIIIYNKALPYPTHDTACIVCELFSGDPSRLHIDSLRQCGLDGETHLKRVIAFAEGYGISRITLEDGSRIIYTPYGDPTDTSHSISLKQFRRLMKGESWYEKFGFTNHIIEASKKSIEDYINTPIGIIHQYKLIENELIENELILQIHDYVSEIDSKITSDKMRMVPVKKAVSYLSEFLTRLCPNRICNPDEVIDIVDEIDKIVDILYQGMLTHLGLVDTNFTFLQLNLPRPNQKGSSRKHLRKHSRKHSRRTQKKHNKKARKRTHKKF